MQTEKIMKIILVSVVVVIVVLFALYGVKAITGRGELQALTSVDLAFDYENFPCLYACYTSLQGTEKSLITSYYSLRGSNVMVNYFACNYELMSVATMVYELAKWNVSDTSITSAQRLIEKMNAAMNNPQCASPLTQQTGIDYYESAKSILFNCLKTGDCDNIIPSNALCMADDYLYGFTFFPCGKTLTLNKMINPVRSYYTNRSGTDIYNNFLCYGGPYDLCAPGPDTGYGDDCRPSWITLKGFNEGGYSYGRCEDFAILYYSLFRSIGVPVNELSINISYCDLPCPCKKLVNNLTMLDYEELYCSFPANVSVAGRGVIEACSLVYNSDRVRWDQGIFRLSAEDNEFNYIWIINQSKYGVNNATFVRKLIFDDDPSNDFNFTYFGFDNGTPQWFAYNSSPSDPCNQYDEDWGYDADNLTLLAAQCDLYVSQSIKENIIDKSRTAYSLSDFVADKTQ